MTAHPRFTQRVAALTPRGRRYRTRILDTQTITDLILQGMPDAVAHVQGDDGVHFEALIVSPAFAGKLPLARHRMVYATLGALMGREIHALALTTKTPEEHAAATGSGQG